MYRFFMSLLFISLPFPSTVITNIILVVVGLLVIYFNVNQGLQRITKNQKIIFIGLFLLVLSVMIPSFFYEKDYLNNNITRPLYFLIIPLLFFMGEGLNLKNIKAIKKLFVIAVIIFSFIGFLKMLYLYYMQVENKLFFDAFARTLKIHTTSFAYLTVLAFAFSFNGIFDKSNNSKYTLYYAGQSLYLIVLLFLISTRIAFIAIAALIVVILINQFRQGSYRRGILYASLISLLILFLSYNGYLSERVENVYNVNIENKSDLENRFVIWNCATQVFEENDFKIFGLGLENSNDLLRDCYYQKNFFGKDLGYHAHNQYLQTLIAGGIIGFLVLMFLMIYAFIQAIKHRNLALLAFILVFSIFFITESVFEQQIGVTTFSLFLGLFFCHKKINHQS